MNADTLLARSAIESLRSGVPSQHAAAQLGTTQRDIKDQFDASLEDARAGRATSPLVITANFGAGKSHLLNYLKATAAQQQFVTSYLVVSPEMPLGNAVVVVKALAENAQAAGRAGRALRALAPDLSPAALGLARQWAREADIDDRFRALLHVYEEYRVDPEFRALVLSDFEGRPLLKTVIQKRLKEIGQAAAYDLSGPKNALLAHDRIRLLAQLYRVATGRGLVVLIDEVERLAKFSLNQRGAAYQELGWWAEVAAQPGSGILPVFTMTDNFLDECVLGGKRDAQKFFSSVMGFEPDDRDALASRGIELLKSNRFLTSPTHAEAEEIRYRIKAIYEQAYQFALPSLPDRSGDVRTTLRSEIRRWITQWDLYRYDPDYAPDLAVEELRFDAADISDATLAAVRDEEESE